MVTNRKQEYRYFLSLRFIYLWSFFDLPSSGFVTIFHNFASSENVKKEKEQLSGVGYLTHRLFAFLRTKYNIEKLNRKYNEK